jgi:hypothetical protein
VTPHSKFRKKPGMEVYVCNPSTGEAKEFEVSQGYTVTLIRCEFKVSLGCNARPCWREREKERERQRETERRRRNQDK